MNSSLNKISKMFGGLNLTWLKLVIFAVCAGLYAGAMALIPAAKNTSFADITISFEVWMLFGILIITNSKGYLDSGLKCLVFFVISQPIIYLVQVPFNTLGFDLFMYYKNWIIWTICTFPMGFIGYCIKKNNWLGFAILIPIMLLLGAHIGYFAISCNYNFPMHLLSLLFCVVTMFLYAYFIFEKREIKITCCIVGGLIVVSAIVFALLNPLCYSTSVAVNGGGDGDFVFDDTYEVKMSNESLGNVSIGRIDSISNFSLNGEFYKAGETELVLTAPDGTEQHYWLTVGYSTYDITKL